MCQTFSTKETRGNHGRVSSHSPTYKCHGYMGQSICVATHVVLIPQVAESWGLLTTHLVPFLKLRIFLYFLGVGCKIWSSGTFNLWSVHLWWWNWYLGGFHFDSILGGTRCIAGKIQTFLKSIFVVAVTNTVFFLFVDMGFRKWALGRSDSISPWWAWRVSVCGSVLFRQWCHCSGRKWNKWSQDH